MWGYHSRLEVQSVFELCSDRSAESLPSVFCTQSSHEPQKRCGQGNAYDGGGSLQKQTCQCSWSRLSVKTWCERDLCKMLHLRDHCSVHTRQRMRMGMKALLVNNLLLFVVHCATQRLGRCNWMGLQTILYCRKWHGHNISLGSPWVKVEGVQQLHLTLTV